MPSAPRYLTARGGTRTPSRLTRSEMLYPLSYERRSRSVYARGRPSRRCDTAGSPHPPLHRLLERSEHRLLRGEVGADETEVVLRVGRVGSRVEVPVPDQRACVRPAIP